MSWFLRIESSRHPLINQWRALRDRQKNRHRIGEVFVEGSQLIKEIAPLITPIALIASSEQMLLRALKSFQEPRALKCYLISEVAMKRISGLITFQGLCMICKTPIEGQIRAGQRWLICDQIGDPGNLGTLIRTACAFEWDGVYLLGECCDPFNAKALRASRASALKIPIARGTLTDLMHHRGEKTDLLIASASGKTSSFPHFEQKRGLWLALGNESRGICPKLAALGKSITIQARGMESLNVACAGAILLHALAKRSFDHV